MKRPTIHDLAQAAGVSISTVDRVLNGRNPVRRDKAEAVLAAAHSIGFHAEQAIRHRVAADRPERVFGFILLREKGSFYQAVAHALRQAVEAEPAIRGRLKLVFQDDLSPSAVADGITSLAKTVDAVAIVAADHPRVSLSIDQATEQGVPVIALISDLTAAARAAYVGLDNWKVGRTAGWAITHLCHHPGKVAILIGSHRYLCQDVAEMSFRSYLREHAPAFSIMESVITFEDPGYAYENTFDLLKRTPDLAGLWVAGGGIEGVIQAIRDSDAAQRLITIGRDLTDDTRAALIEGSVKLILSHPLKAMAAASVTAMIAAISGSTPGFQQCLLPFDLWTAENV